LIAAHLLSSLVLPFPLAFLGLFSTFFSLLHLTHSKTGIPVNSLQTHFMEHLPAGPRGQQFFCGYHWLSISIFSVEKMVKKFQFYSRIFH
jgi:hypothetical protein